MEWKGTIEKQGTANCQVQLTGPYQ